jgi:hypothetical protein
MDYQVIFLIIFIFILIAWFTPTSLTNAKKEGVINKLNSTPTETLSKVKKNIVAKKAKPEDFFTLGLLLADDVDAEFEPEVFQSLTLAMNGIAERQAPITDDDEYMVRRAGDLRNIGAQQMIALDDFELGLALDAAINGAHNRVRSGPKERQIRAAQAETRQEKQEILFEPTFTSDSQNTHERGVLNDTAQIIANIRIDPLHVDKSLREINAAIDECDDAMTRRRALIALNKARERILIDSLGENEATILALVWERANHRNNRENADMIREAVVDCLADCVDKQSMLPVCVTGRATRIVGALATLDFDNKSSIVMTHEMYKNEIFNDTKKIIDSIVAEYKNAGDKAREYADAYEAGEDGDNDLTKDMCSRIIENIKHYEKKLGPEAVIEMTKTCLEYAGLI